MTGAELLTEAVRRLARAGVPDGARDARRLMAYVLRVPAGRLTLFLPEPVTPERIVAYRVLIERRAERVPVSHLTGRRLFYGREFLVTRDVLDPRPETETLVEAALAEPYASVLDLGTGSGCILMTLLLERPGSYGIGTDLSLDALEVAFWNRNALGLERRALLNEGAWYDALEGEEPGSFDLIVSNPPYIAADEMAALAPEVRDHEPRVALTDEADGLSAYRAIVSGAVSWLVPGGRLLLEIGMRQGGAVAALAREAGLERVGVVSDLDGRDRVVTARKPQ